ncbi:MAG TPA: response regulator [Acidimicrobiales bacterium]|nr:response regulator [Acidimicrobiales bacterium]
MNGPLLIVDDESDVRQMLALVFKAQGWATEEAGSADEGLERCRRSPIPTAVIVDQRMPPGPSGLDMVRVLRDEGFPAPIVLHSAQLTPAAEEEARAIGLEVIAKGDLRGLVRTLTTLRAAAEG